MSPRIVFTKSAFKHDVSDADIMWALTHVMAYEDVEDTANDQMEARRYIGMAKPPSTTRLEIVASVDRKRQVLVVFHAMEMRPKYQYLLDQQWE